MSAGRIYWGQITGIVLVLGLGAQLAVQYVAHKLDHQAALGAPDFVIADEPIYAPWRLFIWWFQYDAYARSVFQAGGLILLASSAASVGVAFFFSLWRSREERASQTYGSARWANPTDIHHLNLLQGDGVILGAWRNRILRHAGDDHVLVIAPTNTGKSVGVSLPTGLVWRDSYIALDLKAENWRTTSGLRARLGPVIRFEPSSAATHRYNPLTQIRIGEAEVRDAQVLADMLVDPEGALGPRSHWQLRAFELLTASILFVLYAEKDKTLSRLAELLADPGRPVVALLEEMLMRPIRDGAPHPVVAAGARQLLDMAEAERSGVVSTALGYLSLYRDPVLANATAVSDFAIEDLVCGSKPVSLYLVVPPEEISRLRALLRLVLNQILKRLTELAAAEDGQNRRVLLMLDEFPQLGRLDFFEHALAYIRGYRIKACLIAQSLNQIAQTYGEHSSILDNAHVRIAFACNDERTARRISDMLGVTTETRAQMNYAGSRMAPWLGHTMVSRQEVPRPLLTPGEVMQLPNRDGLILIGGAPPIRSRKIRYFEEPVFTSRLRPPVRISAQSGPGLPTPWDRLAPPPPTPPKPATHSSFPTRRQRTNGGRAPDARQTSFAFSPTEQAAREPTHQPDDRQSPGRNPSSAMTEPASASDAGSDIARTIFALDSDSDCS